ncbi:YhcN/YlaJ family sporulation lipoprotein [Paenibacillus xylaniclasticus]|uniref:YhcN/YlaJ family sporulation lipoprotein n=1 Tax=Paenibacillus xylaniclasticus TaxID=588083 RepID=UPI000FD81CC9|nr:MULTISPECIES: YhcN/YlaJ family sporulation lipoprotein [Paenibacillus]GFN31607.1 hypothetical protein PCURB6_18670 [Paenibacillus curdlanolyticus]
MRKTTGALLLTTALMVSMTTACGDYRDDNNKVNQYRTRNISEPAPYLNQSRPYSTPYGSKSFTGYSNNTGSRYLNNGNASRTAANKALADRISKKATAVNGVDKATVFVHDNNVLVGLDIRRGMNARSVESKVRNSVKNLEPGYKVHITSDKALHGRIQRLQDRLNGTGTTSRSGMNGTYNNNNTSRPYALNNGSYNMRGANAPDMYNSYNYNRYNTNGTNRGLGLDDMTRGLDGYGMNDTNRGIGFGDRYSQNHPIRSMADDVGDIIRDIGNAITYPLR